ncbi:MAG: alpha-galactosidase [Verrucomicrobia bacterium]|nr:alpha-galactosidase [Verrucomicrobiota bacterium]
MAKVVIIGAGSLGFSRRLTIDILSYAHLEDTKFALVDINEKRLAYACRIIERIFREGGYDKARYVATTDRRKVLPGADYVISALLVGGYEAIEKEIDIAQKYGVDQCIGDTLTPGGIMRCLRTLPHQAGIAQDIMELCPKAILLNYTNPMSMLCWGMYRQAPGIKLVGLCHSVQGTSEQWAGRLGENIADLTWKCAGINHQAWFYTFEKDGVDLLPRIRERACDSDVWLGDSVRSEYVKHFGYPVTESSGHVSEYTGWWRKRPALIPQYCSKTHNEWNGGSGFIKDLYRRPEWEAEMEKMASDTQPMDLKRSQEYGSQIISACEGGDTVVIHGNVENTGLIDNLPQGACIEGPIYVDRNGLQPMKVGKLPMPLAAINRNQISMQELAVEAAIQSDPEIVFQAMAMDPLTQAVLCLDEIRDMTRELLEAHAFCLPNFKGKSLAAKPCMVGCSATEVEQHVDPGEAEKLVSAVK